MFADLPWYQKKVASVVFATPPSSSYDEVLYSLLGNKGWYLSLGKVQIRQFNLQGNNIINVNPRATETV